MTQPHQQHHARNKTPRLPLARAYDGYFVHHAYGPVHIDIQVRLETTTEGSWQALGQHQKIAVQRQSDGRILMYDREDAETQLEGAIDAQTGSIAGEVIQCGERGGRFILESLEGAPPAAKHSTLGRIASVPGLRFASRDFGGGVAEGQVPLPALLTNGLCAGGPQHGRPVAGKSSAKGCSSQSHRTPAGAEANAAAGQVPACAGAHASFSPPPVSRVPQATVAAQQAKRVPRHSWPDAPQGPAAAPRCSPRVATPRVATPVQHQASARR